MTTNPCIFWKGANCFITNLTSGGGTPFMVSGGACVACQLAVLNFKQSVFGVDVLAHRGTLLSGACPQISGYMRN